MWTFLLKNGLRFKEIMKRKGELKCQQRKRKNQKRKGDRVMAIEKIDYVYTFVGAMGIYLAHGIENYYQEKENDKKSIDHMSRIAGYWTLGALAYFAILRS